MNDKIMKDLGFEKEVELKNNNCCPFCKTKIDLTKFKDPLSFKEYKISGLCQTCQDKMFG